MGERYKIVFSGIEQMFCFSPLEEKVQSLRRIALTIGADTGRERKASKERKA